MNKIKVWEETSASRVPQAQLPVAIEELSGPVGRISRLCNLLHKPLLVLYDIFCASVICYARYRWDVTNYSIWQWTCDTAPKGRLAVKQLQFAARAFHPQRSFPVGCLQLELTVYNVRNQCWCWKRLLCYASQQNKLSHPGARDSVPYGKLESKWIYCVTPREKSLCHLYGLQNQVGYQYRRQTCTR